MTGFLTDIDLLPVLASVATPIEATTGLAEQRWWDDDHDGWGGGGWFVMMGFMLVFWVVVAALVVWAVRSFNGRPGQGPAQPASPRSPLDIAMERYAKGEINDEELERIKVGLRRQ